MISVKRTRASLLLVCALNLLGIVGTGAWSFRRSAFAEGARPPAGFSPVAYALDAEGPRRLDVAVVWRELDRPLPAPVLPSAPESAPDPPLAWRLVLASVSAERPELSTGIVVDAGGGQSAVRVGERLGERTVERIEIVEEEGARRAVLTLQGGAALAFRRPLNPGSRRASPPSAPGP